MNAPGINETGLIPPLVSSRLIFLSIALSFLSKREFTYISGPITVFEKFFSRKEAPLTGAPPVRRLKTYSAQSGYVYQYYYEGQRPFRSAGETGTEFVFTISADRKTWRPGKVFVGDPAIAAWESAHGRELSATERYAIGKMALFQAFDERATPALMKARTMSRELYPPSPSSSQETTAPAWSSSAMET